MAQFQGKEDGKRIITHLRSFVANLEMSFLVPTFLSVIFFFLFATMYEGAVTQFQGKGGGKRIINRRSNCCCHCHRHQDSWLNLVQMVMMTKVA